MEKNEATQSSEPPFLPFWATPQYAAGLLQGMGIILAGMLILTQMSPDFYSNYSHLLGGLGFILLVVGGLRARRAAADS